MCAQPSREKKELTSNSYLCKDEACLTKPNVIVDGPILDLLFNSTYLHKWVGGVYCGPHCSAMKGRSHYH